MSDDYQNTSNLLPNRILTKREKTLFNFLKDGPREYSEILEHLKRKKISKSTSNRLLNRNVEENRILRIEKGNRVFYRINDFPLNVKASLVLLDCSIKEKEFALSDISAKERESSFSSGKEGENWSEAVARKFCRHIYQTQNKQWLVAYQTLKRNIVRLYPKLDLREIVQLSIAEISASDSGNQSVLNFLEGLKVVLD